MNEKAIVATDLSDASLFMVKHVFHLHALHITSIILLQCPDYSEIASDVFPYIASLQEDMLEKQKEILIASNFKVEVRISPGNAAHEINRVAVELDINLVVVGSMGHSLITGALLGGVAQSVMLHTSKPLLIMRLLLNEEGQLTCFSDSLINHVLFCTDFSENSFAAFDSFLVLMSSGEVKKVTILHVIGDKQINYHGRDSLHDITTIVSQRLSVMKQRVKSVGVRNVEISVHHAKVNSHIVDFIQKEGVTLTVLSMRGTSFMKELLATSVSQYVAHHSPSSVLLLPKN